MTAIAVEPGSAYLTLLDGAGHPTGPGTIVTGVTGFEFQYDDFEPAEPIRFNLNPEPFVVNFDMTMSPEFIKRWFPKFANRCYAAEHVASARAWKTGPPLLTPVEARAFAEHVVADQQWDPVTVEFYTGRNPAHGRGYASSSRRLIRLTRRNQTKWLVLHELAHIEAGVAAGHGPQFRAVYLRLCEQYLPRYARSLRAAFRRYKIEPA